jgi:hypothetical protein
LRHTTEPIHIVFLSKNCRLSQRSIPVDTNPHMESGNRDLQSTSKYTPPFLEDDAELEREFQEMAQWLLDVYLWRLQQERKTRGDGPVIDNAL